MSSIYKNGVARVGDIVYGHTLMAIVEGAGPIMHVGMILEFWL